MVIDSSELRKDTQRHPSGNLGYIWFVGGLRDFLVIFRDINITSYLTLLTLV